MREQVVATVPVDAPTVKSPDVSALAADEPEDATTTAEVHANAKARRARRQQSDESETHEMLEQLQQMKHDLELERVAMQRELELHR